MLARRRNALEDGDDIGPADFDDGGCVCDRRLCGCAAWRAAISREHLSRVALEVNWAVSRWTDSSCCRRAQRAECVLHRGGKWRRLEIGRFWADLDADF